MSSPTGTNTTQTVNLFRRLLAILYDCFLLGAILFVAAGIALALNGGTAIEPDSLFYWPYRISMLAICYTYFCWFWLHGGQTLGMKTWRMKLHREGGLNWMSATMYFCSAALSWSLLGTGFLLALFHPRKKTLHDLINRTEMQDLR